MTESTTMARIPTPAPPLLKRYAREALAEDLGTGDVTSDLLVPATARARGVLVARQPGTVCGLALAAQVFLSVDPDLDVETHGADGQAVGAGAHLLSVSGTARSLLAAERVALNFVGHLSGIATATRRYVEAVEGTGVAIMDTRKTTPGLRVLERWAVACGGGTNHRFDLSAGFMLKDNHRAALAAAGLDLAGAVRTAKERLPRGVLVTVEVDGLDQLEEAVAAGADVVLLDNMDPRQLAEAVRRVGGRARTEASGGITLASVGDVAASGVDQVSVGAITHSAPALDVALDFEWESDPQMGGRPQQRGS